MHDCNIIRWVCESVDLIVGFGLEFWACGYSPWQRRMSGSAAFVSTPPWVQLTGLCQWLFVLHLACLCVCVCAFMLECSSFLDMGLSSCAFVPRPFSLLLLTVTAFLPQVFLTFISDCLCSFLFLSPVDFLFYWFIKCVCAHVWGYGVGGKRGDSIAKGY